MLETVAAHVLKQSASAASSLFLREKINALLEQINSAKLAYDRQPKDTDSDFEKRRRLLYRDLGNYQHRILFEVSDPQVISVLGTYIIEQGLCLFKANCACEFEQIDLNLQKVGTALDKNQQQELKRQYARTLVVLVPMAAIVCLAYLAVSLTADIHSMEPWFGIPRAVVLWSALGGLGAMLYKFNRSANAELADPLRWSFTRPLTGILMGMIAYLALKAGGLILEPSLKGSVTTPEFISLAAFLAGFSDKFGEAVLKTLNGRLGGEKGSDLVTLDAPTHISAASLTKVFSDSLDWAQKPRADGANLAAQTHQENIRGIVVEQITGTSTTGAPAAGNVVPHPATTSD